MIIWVMACALVCFCNLSFGINWDIIDETYGNGSGQVTFHDSYDYDDNGYMVETLFDGYAELSPGLLGAYPCKTNISGFPINSDVTIELKVQDVSKSGLEIFYSETNNRLTSAWNNTVYINYSSAGSDTIVDLNKSLENLAPEGFDGSEIHTYRFVRQDVKSLFYLFDNDTPYLLSELTNLNGAANDGRNLMFGIPSPAENYRFYHLKMGSGAEIPEPATLLLLGLGAVMAARKR